MLKAQRVRIALARFFTNTARCGSAEFGKKVVTIRIRIGKGNPMFTGFMKDAQAQNHGIVLARLKYAQTMRQFFLLFLC